MRVGDPVVVPPRRFCEGQGSDGFSGIPQSRAERPQRVSHSSMSRRGRSDATAAAAEGPGISNAMAILHPRITGTGEEVFSRFQKREREPVFLPRISEAGRLTPPCASECCAAHAPSYKLQLLLYCWLRTWGCIQPAVYGAILAFPSLVLSAFLPSRPGANFDT